MPLILKAIVLFSSSSYERVHKQLETCALVTKTTVACIEILQSEIEPSHDEKRIQSAFKSLVEIFMTCINIERTWLPLFRQAFESVVCDPSIRDHCKIYIKYLKILKNLKEFEALLKSAIQMLESYPDEYIPLDMVCMVYVKQFEGIAVDFSVSEEVSCYNKYEGCLYLNEFFLLDLQSIAPKPIDAYSDGVLAKGGPPSFNALMAKAISSFENHNFVTSRDYLHRGNSLRS